MKNSYLEKLYNQGQYLKNNPNWDQEDVNWKLQKLLPSFEKLVSKNSKKSLHVAEIGCGSGLLLKKLAQMYPACEFYGYDISTDAETFWSDNNLINLRFEVCPLEKIQKKFDLILLIDVIEHVPDPILFLENAREKTETLLIHLPLDLSALTIIHEAGLIRQRRKVGHIHYYTQGIAEQLLEETGWSPIDIFLTDAWKHSPKKLPLTILINFIRNVLYFILNKKVAARIVGGNTLVVLAKKISTITPLVSIIMPIYNAEKFLKPAIDSCLNQSYQNLEIIVVDDGSTDKTAEICKEYTDHKFFHYVKNETNQGLIFSLNKAVSLSHGQFIARMDQDDIALPYKIQKQVQYMMEHPEVEALGTDVVLMADSDEMLGKPRQLLTNDSAIEWAIISTCPLHHPTVIFNRTLLSEKKFSEELYAKDQHYAEDLGLWSKILLQNKKIQVLKEPLLLYRKHSHSMSTIYKTPQLNGSIDIARNYALQKWGIKIGEHFLKSIRTRNRLDHKTFFVEAKELLKELREKAPNPIADTALMDIQSLCFECLHFLILKRESNRMKAAYNSLSFLLKTFDINITPKALSLFYRGLYRRFFYIKLNRKKYKDQVS
jgi:glycosyltransferase involved in cell wall biosynthesis/SAM-dependent methyltransferase